MQLLLYGLIALVLELEYTVRGVVGFRSAMCSGRSKDTPPPCLPRQRVLAARAGACCLVPKPLPYMFLQDSSRLDSSD